jgi:hypothetical protein
LGYDLHVTRGDTWLESEATPIAFGEWEAYVLADVTLRPEEETDNGCVLWTQHPKEPCRLWWLDGEVRCKNPDEAAIVKLVAIATALDARVVGDDGEEYYVDPTGVVKREPAMPDAPTPQQKRRNSWWERLIDRLNGYRPED